MNAECHLGIVDRLQPKQRALFGLEQEITTGLFKSNQGLLKADDFIFFDFAPLGQTPWWRLPPAQWVHLRRQPRLLFA